MRLARADEIDVAGDEEAATMVRVARHDAAAFRTLIDANAERLRQIAWRMTADAAEAEDIAQEALLRLWEHAARWRPGGGAIGAWLTRVAMNLCFDRLRRRRFVSEEDAPERHDETPGADVLLDTERRRAAVAGCIRALPERQRAAIVLTYYEELSNLAAAQAMEMNIKAFESLLLRARQALRGRLAAANVLSSALEEAR